jgi:starch synthase
MNIVMIASEAVPFAKTGGLADVAGTLPRTLAALGDNVSLILPFYGKKTDAKQFGVKPLSPELEVTVPVGGAPIKGKILTAMLGPKVKVYFIAQPVFFNRDELYQTVSGDYPDNAERFIFFSRAAIEAIHALGQKPDIVHVHDWQAALVPVYLKTIYKKYKAFAEARTLLTIHNLGYQGLFPKEDLPLTGLAWDVFTFDHLEYWGKVGFLKGGIMYADAISTVSRRYAQEILTEEQGLGLEGALTYRRDSLSGILNGIDEEEWNPETDKFIAASFGPRSLAGKQSCKSLLLERFRLPPRNRTPLIGLVGRLTSQKGFDILCEALPQLMERDLSIVILGTGEEKYHKLLAEDVAKYPGRIGLALAFDNALAHQIEAGSDLFLMPSHYEPCGLNQMISLKYGTVPVVRATGGLDDSIEDFNAATGKGNGFKFGPYSAETLVAACDRALAAYQDPALWKSLVENAMTSDCSWTHSAKEYRALYKKMLGKK